MAVLGVYVNSHFAGGTDKSAEGIRPDTIPICNAMIDAGNFCVPLFYIPGLHVPFFLHLAQYDAIIVRINPGQISQIGGDQDAFDRSMRAIRKRGIAVWSSPDVMIQMGAKDALCKIAKLDIGLEDTLAYYDEAEFAEGFKKTMAFQPRVVKQNRGSSGEGIWICKLKEGNYCSAFGERSCDDSEVISMMEANDNHAEEHTVGEFIEFCVNGRTSKSGTWTSVGVGKYLEGGKAAGGQLVDQRFCPRIVEGEVRVFMVVDTPTLLIHKKPKEGGISAVGGTGSIYTYFGPDAPEYADLIKKFTVNDMPKIMPSLGLETEPLPLVWTGDFIPVDDDSAADKTRWIIGEFNCSCVGLSKFQGPGCVYDEDGKRENGLHTVPEEDLKEGNKLCALMAAKAMDILGKSANAWKAPMSLPISIGPCEFLLPQPANPKYKMVICETYVPKFENGGTDKGVNGHRPDTIPIANGMIKAGCFCQPLRYWPEFHDQFFEYLKEFDAVIVRINPGQITQQGGNQDKFDADMRAIRKRGIPVWSSPDVMIQMGAKDALCKIAKLDIGLEDTLAYYDEAEFSEGFKKTMAFQPRVVKQNRGSSGGGIWICKLKEGNYCSTFGERSCEDSEVISMMEANDNHAEEHTVGEFIEFCVNGRTSKSGTWTSVGVGKYLEGGK